ncbi:uncharacterized protein LOC8064080 isoform X1 [Sorghum bicolor]|uniref:Uncharacterized protein n=1 Tax=Sorghum bicolor TaxID=4558 RepID=A0A1B6PCN7_SORBI|nr:uncharacterized protein LOC8064080 isoform X1 [Sorghum bicolor]KXG23466.1 hypothetical protein SORBI_3008G099100 [Sorghum bicolor]|eukprot:XP_021301632.1 uncharacterized protein LOC8064080 isoform X1 [Sorghum bicolor]
MEQGQGGRRRQIPAFGRWNQHSDDDDVPITHYFESAVQAGLLVRPGGHCYHAAAAGELVLFRSSASPPPHKPAKKVRSTTTMESNGHHQQLEAGSRRQPQRQEAFVAGDGGSRAAARPRRPRVVRAAVDEDLYKVPSDMLRKKKGRKHVRSMWMGCVGLNCVA